MKNIIQILTLIFCANFAHGKEIRTSYFTLTIPDSLTVEAKEGTLLVFGENGPYTEPLQFMALEYNAKLDINVLVADINEKLGQQKKGEKLKKVKCSCKCIAYFGSVKKTENKLKVNSLFYIIKGEKVTVVISYGFSKDYSTAKKFIDHIAQEVIMGDI